MPDNASGSSTTPPQQSLHPLLVVLLAPLSGALVTLSLAPFNLWPAGILSCAIYGYLLCRCNTNQAIWRGWLFGLGLFGSGASWVYVSIHVYGYASVPLAALLTLLFCAGLALLHSLFALSYVRWVRALPGGMLLGFPALWVLFEWLRSWLLTGFPWLYLGYAHIDTWIAGWAPIFGVFGLSFICALTGICLFLCWRSRQAMSITTYVGLILTLWIGGSVLQSIKWVDRASEQPLSVAIYQPNIPQEHKWDPAWYRPILSQFESAVEESYGSDIILWPESAIPSPYYRAKGFLDDLANRASESESTLITGIPTRSADGQSYYNSIVSLGQGRGQYDKQRLVPFGEYVPLESWLRGLIRFFDLPMSNFSPGTPGQQLLRADSYRVAPFICYEVVYPDLVAKSAREADLLITISNDSWFGRSIGPLQHLQMARMRALENGRYMLRGTNNGVSAIIDHRGQLVTQSEQFVTTTLHGKAEVMLGQTPFSSFGSAVVVAGSGLALAIMLLLYLAFWRDSD